MIRNLDRLGTYLMAAAIAVCGYYAVRFWLAERILDVDPTESGLKRAVQWNPRGDYYHYLLAINYRDALDTQDLDAAVSEFQSAIKLNPRNWSYHNELAVAREFKGDWGAAEVGFQKALHLNPRSADLHWHLANFYVRRENAPAAAREFRAAVELDAAKLNPAASRLAALGLTEEEIAEKLVPLRQADLLNFLDFTLDRLQSQPERAVSIGRRLWEKLEKTPQREFVKIPSAYRYLDFLLKQNYLDDARRTWFTALRLASRDLQEDDEESKIVFNGGFERESVNGGLDWVFVEDPAVEFTYDREERFRGLVSLRMDFSGKANPDFSGLQQTVILPAGRLTLSFAAKCKDITSDQGISLEVHSLRDNSLLARSTNVFGSQPWSRFSVDFEVPRATAASIVVRRYPSQKFDGSLGGSLWLDEVEIFKKGEKN
jgi:tetratricopeptide (TPR) repeat protein